MLAAWDSSRKGDSGQFLENKTSDLPNSFLCANVGRVSKCKGKSPDTVRSRKCEGNFLLADTAPYLVVKYEESSAKFLGERKTKRLGECTKKKMGFPISGNPSNWK